GVSGKVAAQALDRAGLVANYNTVPFDQRKPFDPSGIRLGTPAATTRGLREPEMKRIGRWISEGVTAAAGGDEAAIQRIRREVTELAAAYPLP
ncbi:MAG: serine hydroxymethyltransferase, partial [Chloroflexota bacterium]|nr:serine hydroxymethyltransferase [Chloroflexota bacterium]